MTAPTILPTRVPAPSRPTWRTGIDAARRALHRSEFPAVDQRHEVDEALATTRAVRP